VSAAGIIKMVPLIQGVFNYSHVPPTYPWDQAMMNCKDLNASGLFNSKSPQGPFATQQCAPCMCAAGRASGRAKLLPPKPIQSIDQQWRSARSSSLHRLHSTHSTSTRPTHSAQQAWGESGWAFISRAPAAPPAPLQLAARQLRR
jgi:hypothetical protein